MGLDAAEGSQSPHLCSRGPTLGVQTPHQLHLWSLGWIQALQTSGMECDAYRRTHLEGQGGAPVVLHDDAVLALPVIPLDHLHEDDHVVVIG